MLSAHSFSIGATRSMRRLTPADPKSTVMTEFRPLSCASVTLPRPYWSWLIMSPTAKSEIFSPLSLAILELGMEDTAEPDFGVVWRVVTLPSRVPPDAELEREREPYEEPEPEP